MDIEGLKKLIAGGESVELEFKTSTAKLKNACETLCALVNTRGGAVLIGVKDDGSIIGQHVTDETRLEISNLIAKFEPPIGISAEYILVSKDKYVILMSVTPNHSTVPYTFDGRAYWRLESSTKRMPQQRYNELLLEYANKLKPWDAELANQISVDDLDSEEVIETLNESIERGRTESKLATNNVTDALLRLKMIKNKMLTNAAGVLFCRDAESDYPQCLIRLARFKGVAKGNIVDSKRIYGNAFQLMEEAEIFIMRHMSISSEFIPGKMARLEHPEYSLRAAREAIVNAICHRDYTIIGGSISVMMYDDRLEVSSHGTLPNGISIQDLLTTHESIPRNEKITHIMYKRGIIESVGMGTQEIFEECKKIGAPDPQYIERGNIFVVVLRSNPLVRNHDEKKLIMNPRHLEILKIMTSFEGGCTTTQILKLMTSPPTDRTLRSDLTELEKQDYVVRQGDGRTTLWMLK
jgi:ATP-dependent DNA helicase RecG